MAFEYRNASIEVSTATNQNLLSHIHTVSIPVVVGTETGFVVNTYCKDGIETAHEHGPQFLLNLVGFRLANGLERNLSGVERARNKNFLKISCDQIQTDLEFVSIIETKLEEWQKQLQKNYKKIMNNYLKNC